MRRFLTIGYCLVAALAASPVRGELVWVSSTVSGGGMFDPSIDILATSAGELSLTAQNNSRHSFAETSGDERWTRINISTADSYTSGDRRIAVDISGAYHTVFTDRDANALVHGWRTGTTWALETVLPNYNWTNWSTISTGGTGGLQMAHMDGPILNYGVRTSSGWSFETVLIVRGIMLATDSAGDPFIIGLSSSGAQPLRVVRKSGGQWITLRTLSGSWTAPTLRIDSQDRLHMALIGATYPSTLAPVRYVRMSASGVIELDQTYPPLQVGQVPNYPGLALDENDWAHIAVSSAYITTQDSQTHALPTIFNKARIAMLGGMPYIFGTGSGNTLLALLHRPAPPQISGRGPNQLTWTWSPVPTSNHKGYRVIRSSDNADLSGLISPAVTLATITGLSPNSFHTVATRAVYIGLHADSSSTASAYTLADAPGSLALSRPSGNSVGLSWSPEANPPGTRYRARLVPPAGLGITQETTNQTALFALLDQTLPYGVTVSGVSEDGAETFVSTLTRINSTGDGTEMAFALSDGLEVEVNIQGPTSPPALAIGVAPASVFPAAPASSGDYAPTAIGFQIPTSQPVPPGQTVLLTLRYPEGTLSPSSSTTLARYDADRNLWVPLATQVDAAARTLTAPTRALGLFQVLTRTSLPINLGAVTAYPNPFRPSQHGALALREVPAGTQLKIHSSSGRLIRTLALDGGTPTWDGRDGSGELVHSGVYVLILEQGGNTQRIRVVVER